MPKKTTYCKNIIEKILWLLYGVITITLLLVLMLVTIILMILPYIITGIYCTLRGTKDNKSFEDWNNYDTKLINNTDNKFIKFLLSFWTNKREPMPIGGEVDRWKNKSNLMRYILWHIRNPSSDFKHFYVGFYNKRNDYTQKYIFKKGDYHGKFISTLDKVDNLIIDKFPLRFIDVGIVNKIFPNAKYIFAVRHPLDCILSCFMQNFEINDSMANFYTLEESAHFYFKCMDLWKKYVETLNPNVYYIYYENLINNFEEETKSLTSFLNLDIDEKMFEYYKNASTSTPGYNQIIKKPYKDAIYRFEKYNKYYEEEIRNKIQPFIDWFGY